MSAESIVEAFARGLAQGMVAQQSRVKAVAKPERKPRAIKEAALENTMPLPGFDHVGDPRAHLPPATFEDLMQIERDLTGAAPRTNGRSYDPDERSDAPPNWVAPPQS